MSSDTQIPTPEPTAMVLAVRMFGWSMITALGAFMINNYLNLAHGWPGAGAAFGETDAPGKAWAEVFVYVAAIGAACGYCWVARGETLRADAARISNFNAYLIRAAFFGVLLVGVADAAISFLRVEGLLVGVVGEELASELGRSQYRGPYVHVPLMLAGLVMAWFSRTLGFTWLALLIVVAELAIVITRFVFSYEQAFMGDLVRFWYAALFLFASAHTLLEEGHVRVDVFYAGFGPRTKGLVNSIGSILLGMSVSWVILAIGMEGPASIINSPMMNFEVSQSGFGMYTKYQMAGFLAVFAITMLIQFSSYLLDAYANVRGDPGAREVEAGPAH